MKFWIFMLVMNLLTPLVMIIYGRIYEKKPPQKPKSKFAYSGYRTKMSMINIETWEYAHRFFGKLWFRFGIVLVQYLFNSSTIFKICATMSL